MKRIAQWSLAATLILAALLFLVPAAAVVLLNTSVVQRAILARVNDAIPGSLHWERLRVAPARGRLSLRGARIEGAHGGEIVRIERLEAAVAVPALIRRQLVVERLALHGPRLRLRTDTTGVLNIAAAFAPPREAPRDDSPDTAAPPAFMPVLRNLSISDAAVSYTGPGDRVRISAAGVGIQGAGRLAERRARLTLSVDSGSVTVPGYHTAIAGLSARVSAAGRRLDTVELLLRTPASRIALAGSADSLLAGPGHRLSVDISADLAELARSLRLGPRMSGHATLHLLARGTIGDPHADLRLSYEGGTLWGHPLDTLHADLTMTGRHVRLRSIHARHGPGRVDLSGTADLRGLFPDGFLAPPGDADSMRYALSATVGKLDPARFAGRASPVTGTVDAELSVDGRGVTLGALRANAALDADIAGLRAGWSTEAADGRLRLRASAARRVLTLRELSGSLATVAFDASGRYGLAAGWVDLDARIEAPRLGAALSVLGVDGIEGAGRVSAHLGGSVARPAASVELEADSVEAYGYAVDRFRCSAMLDTTGFASVGELEAMTGGSRIHGTGRAKVLEAGRPVPAHRLTFTAALDADTLLLRDFVDSLDGRVAVHARVEGSAAAPRGTARIEADTLDLGAQRLTGARASVRLDSARVDLDTLRVRFAGGDELRGGGWYGFDKRYEFAVRADSLPLSAFDALAEVGTLEGAMTLELAGSGTIDTPRVDGSLRVAELRVDGKPLDDVDLALSLRRMTARVTGTAGFDVDGSYDLEKADFSLSTSFRDVELRPWFVLAGRSGLSGTVDGEMRAGGNLRRLGEVEGELDLSRIELRRGDVLLLAGRAPVRASYQRRRFQLPSVRLRVLEEGDIRVKGGGDLDGRYDLSVDGSIPLRAASLLSPAAPRLEGTVAIDAGVGSTGGPPSLRGTLTLRDVGMIVPALDQRLHGLGGTVELAGDTVRVKNMEGYLDDGRLEVAGSMALDSLRPGRYSATLDANAVPVLVPDMVDLLLDASLKAEGTLDTSWIEGDVVLLRGLYYRDVEINPLGEVGKAARTIEPELDTTSSPLDNVNLDIGVTGREPFQVENNLATLSIAPDLRLRGTLDDPGLTGRASVKEGSIYYRNREFVVKRGVIDFVNPYRIEPTVDIEGTVTVRTWTITLRLSGTPDRLRLQFDSEPPEQDADILSLLVFGKSRGELQETRTATALTPEQMVQQLLRTSRLSENIKERTGLDVLDIEAGGPGGALPVGLTVTVGKKLSPRLTTKVSLQSGTEEVVQRATAEYRLFENALITGFQGSEGTFGGELQLMLEFR